MHYSAIVSLLIAGVPLIAAHGKVPVMTGDAGGNGTALGILGAVIPGEGRNAVTEPDTTTFKGSQADACGRTGAGGANSPEVGTKKAMELSGPILPQVSPNGELSGTFHIVTSDGAGPMDAYLNTDGTAQNWQPLTVTENVPGTRGNIRKTQKRWYLNARDVFVRSVMRRATNINEDHKIVVKMPADLQLTGNLAGQPKTGLVKIINRSNAGPFGGCVPVQLAGANPTEGAQPQAAPGAGPAARRATALKI